MSKSSETAYVKNFKRRINKKLEDVLEDANYMSRTINELTTKLTEKTKHILEDTDTSLDVYKDFYGHLENISEKLFSALNIVTPLFDEVEESANLEKQDLCPVSDGCSNSSTSDGAQELTVQPTSEQGPINEQHTSSELSDHHITELKPLISSLQSKPEGSFSQTSDKIFNIPLDVNSSSNQGLPYNVLSDSSYYSISSSSRPNNLPGLNRNNLQKYDANCSSNLNYLSLSPSSSCLSVSVPSLIAEIKSALSHGDTKSVIELPDPELDIGATYTAAAVTSITSPSDFWIQLKNPDASKISYDINENMCALLVSPELSRIKHFLAPSRLGHNYRRAKLKESCNISDIVNMQTVEVIFVDYGYSESVQVSDLRVLPISSLGYPIQAIWCKLYGVVPVESYWSESAIEQFCKFFEYSDLEVTVKCKCNEQYLVAMTVTMHLPEGTETDSVADVLCLMRFAYPAMDYDAGYDPSMSISRTPTGDFSQNHEQVTEKLLSNTVVKDIHPETLFNQTVQEQHSSSTRSFGCMNLASNPEFDFSQPAYEAAGTVSQLTLHEAQSASDLEIFRSSSVSSASSCAIYNQPANSQFDESRPRKSAPFGKMDPPFDWTLVIPDAKPVFVTRGENSLPLILVSVCSVINPSHFYVNIVSEKVAELDDLREQMTAFYGNCYEDEQDFRKFQCETEDLVPGMFCCCRYELDKYWYRARVDEIVYSEEHADHKVKVHYVDYGDYGLISSQELYPLMPKFAISPAFAVPCSLARIYPKITDSEHMDCNENLISCNNGWDRDAIERFKALTTRQDKCFTAEVMGEKILGNGRCAYDVLLWDILDGRDYIINDILIDEGYAFVDVSLLSNKSNNNQSESIEALQSWNPMADDYDSALNSYGVEISDLEVQTIGHKANDEKTYCKFFSSSRRCPRGDKCPYVHAYENLGDGETRDKVSVFLADNQVSLPAPGSCCLAQVSYVIDPGHFYVVFPYGTDGIIDDPKSVKSHEREFEILQKAMREFYSKELFQDNTAIALAYGTIVVSKSKYDGQWYRARITDVEDINEPVEVFFVDYGGIELVSRKDIREMRQEYMYCPFQAVECFLSNVVPKENKWSPHSKSTFITTVESKVFLAYIKEKIGPALHIVLQGTSKPNDVTINDMLVSHGFAYHASLDDVLNAGTCGDERKNVCYNPGYLEQPG